MDSIKLMNLKKLNKNELIDSNGGCIAYDIGWLLGTVFSGRGSTPAGVMEALTDYRLHYLSH